MIMKTKRLRILIFINCGIFIAIGIIVALFYWGISVPCLFYELTGWQCAGCGNTRAAMALLRLDFASSFSYNLLFPLEFGYIGWVYGNSCFHYMKEGKFLYRSPFLPMDITILLAIVVWGVVRNLI